MPSRRLIHSVLVSTLVASFVFTPVAGLAQSCDPDTEARLAFIESHLDEGQSREKLWWRSWLAVFSIGLVFSTYDGATTRDGSNQAARFIQAGKSGMGILDLTLRSHVGRHGAERIRAMPKGSPGDCAERLQFAEKTLSQAAKMANMRWNWKRHLWSFVINLGTGLAVAEGWDDPNTGWRDFAVSTVSAEVHIWTHPTRAYHDWNAYREEFTGARLTARPSTVRFASSPGGLAVVWKF